RIVLFELKRGNAVLVFVNPLYRRSHGQDFRLRTSVRKDKKPSAVIPYRRESDPLKFGCFK
ncbi:hypothetical protein ACKJOT_10855, partial [Neisseria meningitidis]|uniref:hypothetical protein n=1 Tax=Neisseria meningitidis TaxID=487 RepID=UPI0039890534